MTNITSVSIVPSVVKEKKKQKIHIINEGEAIGEILSLCHTQFHAGGKLRNHRIPKPGRTRFCCDYLSVGSCKN